MLEGESCRGLASSGATVRVLLLAGLLRVCKVCACVSWERVESTPLATWSSYYILFVFS